MSKVFDSFCPADVSSAFSPNDIEFAGANGPTSSRIEEIMTRSRDDNFFKIQLQKAIDELDMVDYLQKKLDVLLAGLTSVVPVDHDVPEILYQEKVNDWLETVWKSSEESNVMKEAAGKIATAIWQAISFHFADAMEDAEDSHQEDKMEPSRAELVQIRSKASDGKFIRDQLEKFLRPKLQLADLLAEIVSVVDLDIGEDVDEPIFQRSVQNWLEQPWAADGLMKEVAQKVASAIWAADNLCEDERKLLADESTTITPEEFQQKYCPWREHSEQLILISTQERNQCKARSDGADPPFPMNFFLRFGNDFSTPTYTTAFPFFVQVLPPKPPQKANDDSLKSFNTELHRLLAPSTKAEEVPAELAKDLVEKAVGIIKTTLKHILPTPMTAALEEVFIGFGVV